MEKIIIKFLKVYQELGFTWLISRLTTSVIAIPIALGIIVISPLIKIRLIKLLSYRIGHYALNTELLLCALKTNHDIHKKWITLFYTTPGQPICNQQLHRMWKRTILILPFSSLCYRVDKWLLIFSKSYRQDKLKNTFEPSEGAFDKWNFLEKIKKSHLSFTEEEQLRGQEEIKKLGITPNAPFICLLGRDPAYLASHLPSRDWSYHDYRNVNINDYKPVAEFLASEGYYVIRMGNCVKDKFEISHPRIIDYANHPLQCDFLDMYLSAHCYFFISPRSGIDAVAQIFRRPVLLINFPLCDINSLFFVNLFITKKIISEEGRHFTFNEMCQPVDKIALQDILKKKKWTVIDNTPEEMVAVAKEMLMRLQNKWIDTEENRLLQKKFWESLPEDAQHSCYRNSMCMGAEFVKNDIPRLTSR